MSKGKKVVPDYIPAGSPEPRSMDVTDERTSAVDNGQDFTMRPDTDQPLADPNEQ